MMTRPGSWKFALASALALTVACKEDMTGSTETGTGTGTGSTGSTGSVTGGALPGLGAMCDHAGDLDFDAGVKLSRDEAGCAGGICAFVDVSLAPIIACASDLDCNAGDPEQTRFVCVNMACQLGEAYKQARSMCAHTCDDDADCAGADPANTCTNGFVCVIASPFCCDKLCLCSDDLSLGEVDLATSQCEMDPAPDCPL